ncbi:MAG: UTP--glucose-1-phosphate uridylyltransferase [Alkalispirochaeta sp.]
MPNISEALINRMKELGIDTERSMHILERFNEGAYDGIEAVTASGIPEIDGERIIDRRSEAVLELPDDIYRDRLADQAPEIPVERFGTVTDGVRRLEETDLTVIGTLLLPYVSYGVLNGGSATSYGDGKKNRAFDKELFELYRSDFERLAPEITGVPKGITPAYLNPDGSQGASFLELKFRMLLLAGNRYRATAERFDVVPPRDSDGAPLRPGLPMVEMTSLFTEDEIRREYEHYRSSEYLADVPEPERSAALATESAVQPLLAAMTHSDEGRPKRFFTNAYGQKGEPLGLPGGHGQNFQVLSEVYRRLRERGKRLVYMGNVDNIGFTLDPVGIALVTLKNAQGGFDFAFRTPVDVKGGVLLYDQRGSLNCADIGPAIKKEEVFAAESEGKKILFNCATGLFNLDYLVPHIDEIVENLPMRISDQDKDAGRYSQAEQVTWEIIGMLDDILIFGIDKYRRFLAAKMLLDMFLTSGLRREEARRIQSTVDDLADGLSDVLRREYGMELREGRWVPAAGSAPRTTSRNP